MGSVGSVGSRRLPEVPVPVRPPHFPYFPYFPYSPYFPGGAGVNDTLDAEEIARGLGTRWMSRSLEVRAETGSTNDDCVALARGGAPAGTVIVADHQTAGRGRRGRRWQAPPGTAVLLSAVLRPRLPAGTIGRLGIAGALAVVEAVWRTTGLATATKYPNDVLLRERKVAGVLPEAHLAGGAIEWAVLGIGINVQRAAVPPELCTQATSLEEHAPPPGRNALIRALLAALETRLERAESDPDALAAEWRACDVVLGRQVSVAAGTARVEGLATDVDPDGRLLLRLPDGTEQPFAPGEVSFTA